MVVWLWFGLLCLMWVCLCCGVGLVIARVWCGLGCVGYWFLIPECFWVCFLANEFVFGFVGCIWILWVIVGLRIGVFDSVFSLLWSCNALGFGWFVFVFVVGECWLAGRSG